MRSHHNDAKLPTSVGSRLALTMLPVINHLSGLNLLFLVVDIRFVWDES